MTRKSIKLKEDAYNMLKSWKGEHESFSDVIRKLAARPKLSDYAGILSHESADRLEKAIRAGRKASMRRQARMLRELK